MTNFDKWKKNITIEMFKSLDDGEAVVSIPCRICPAEKICRKTINGNKGCYDLFKEWAEMEVGYD